MPHPERKEQILSWLATSAGDRIICSTPVLVSEKRKRTDGGSSTWIASRRLPPAA